MSLQELARRVRREADALEAILQGQDAIRREREAVARGNRLTLQKRPVPGGFLVEEVA